MRLADFIDSNVETILLEWEEFARGVSHADKMDSLALREHAPEILFATVRDMRTVQSPAERMAKSKSHQAASDSAGKTIGASEQHAIGRLGSGFDLLAVVSEYRALRASVLRLWHESGAPSHDSDVDDVTRFNESIDQSLAKAVSSYTKRVDQSRDLFLAILGHDLRNPLNSIAMSAAILPLLNNPAPQTIALLSQITRNADVMGRMIGDLLDYTRTRLGAGMPVSPAPMDLGGLCEELYNEFHTAHPNRRFIRRTVGDLRGNWDTDRLRQAISNLLGNAFQHSPENAGIELSLFGEANEVVIVIQNDGATIPPGELTRIFDPLVRGTIAPDPKENRTGSIGLGLYIARQITVSHCGTISVTSSDEDGTAFTMRLPRQFIGHSGQPILDVEQVESM